MFLLATDGVYEWLTSAEMVALIHAHWGDLDAAAEALIAAALDKGSDDNLTVQIVRIDSLPEHYSNELYAALSALPQPPELREGSELDGYRIVRQLHASSRSHVFLAEEVESGEKVALKTLSTELSQDPASIERFVREEWIARRINNVHVLKAPVQQRPRHYLYTVLAYIEGQTLTQWMRDHPDADLASVRPLVEQIAKGLRAFHRLEMLHQDLRPDNVMIDSHGTVKLIDFGAAKVAGIAEEVGAASDDILGTAQYTAPEYFLGEGGTPRSDQYSLAVITYQMLTGTLPYGTEVAKTRTRAAQHKLAYQSALSENRELPAWVDEVLKKALHPTPHKRFPALSEFIFELRSPSPDMLKRAQLPLLERDPVLFWKGVSLALAIVVIALLVR
nr:bifunctional serine/threonine-protein phosphatase/kinase [Halomonas sp. SBBP1]